MENIKIKEVLSRLENYFPLTLQEKWDNSGVQVGLLDDLCVGILLTLDITESIIQEAIDRKCNLIIAHHPLLFHGLKRVGDQSYLERCLRLAIKHDISIYAAHTNIDVAYNGLNYYLGELLKLNEISTLSPNSRGDQSGLGVIGLLGEPSPLPSMLEIIANIFSSQQVRYNQHIPKTVKKVAICGGSAAFLYQEARRQGADIFITGEAKYNDYFDAEGITLITVGHYESEFPVVYLFERIISNQFPNLPCLITNINHNPINIL